jgi:hypothetical protein
VPQRLRKNAGLAFSLLLESVEWLRHKPCGAGVVYKICAKKRFFTDYRERRS